MASSVLMRPYVDAIWPPHEQEHQRDQEHRCNLASMGSGVDGIWCLCNDASEGITTIKSIGVNELLCVHECRRCGMVRAERVHANGREGIDAL